jgi:hypothetical protein
MQLTVHAVTNIEIRPIDGPFAGHHARDIVITSTRGDKFTLTLFAPTRADLALNLKRREVLRGEEGDSASAPDAAVATSDAVVPGACE